MTDHTERALRDAYVRTGLIEDRERLEAHVVATYQPQAALGYVECPTTTAVTRELAARRRRAEEATVRREQRRHDIRATVRMLALCAVVLLAVCGIVKGCQWIAENNWSTAGEVFSCNQGQALHWKDYGPDKTVIWCTSGGR